MCRVDKIAVNAAGFWIGRWRFKWPDSGKYGTMDNYVPILMYSGYECFAYAWEERNNGKNFCFCMKYSVWSILFEEFLLCTLILKVAAVVDEGFFDVLNHKIMDMIMLYWRWSCCTGDDHVVLEMIILYWNAGGNGREVASRSQWLFCKVLPCVF